ncbi:LTA synthase family protein [Flavobacterium oreochromis]|uniref:Sulfatase n=2 Tax=Flavobacterium TaxID=237 RepID=A0A246GF55_9FLAO|nr:alkaline phosphatase family protein [Flavobacterium oreochromis]OWP74871.1 sulfatase [Flavobacterium oreochromis]OWP79351.1 sulfatase [Flavobacterium oreochromis]POR20736.1 sulfatase [Flavobacterium columnare]
MNFFEKKSPYKQLLNLFLLSNFILRIILLFHPITSTSFTWKELGKIFLTGLISDFFVFTIASGLLWLYLLFLSNDKYKKPWGYILFGSFCVLLFYVSFGNTILNEYGGVLPEIGITFIALKTLFFGLMLFLPKHRTLIRTILFSITVFIVVLIIVQNTISEFFFWNEFGVRYNFIAVDYLVYTNEVIKNIMESYPIVPLFTAVGLITVFFTYRIVKKSSNFLNKLPSVQDKLKSTLAYIFLTFIGVLVIPILVKQETSSNVFVNELQANGLYRFYLAFMNSELDYQKFYKTIPQNEAFTLLKEQLGDLKEETSQRTIISKLPETKKNVVLITIESLSADFMKCYGNQLNVTPFLDSLAVQSTQFTNLYAVGNRTIRGLEAVTLCLPPSPGESIVKRKDNKNKFSTGSVFKEKGYTVKYLYGGDAYFDNMEDFFGGNGYEIVDKKTFKSTDITFSNVWGVCDEDMAKKAIQVMNEEAKSGKPFFNHWMTVSNHRPFTYPAGKIDIPNDAKSREGGVKYTDYALRQFFNKAKKQSWYNNTVFVIIADHCASSAGKTELPMDKYRIPAMIFEPNKKGTINPILMSQIDIMPTLLGRLGFSYTSKFYGQDVYSLSYKPRAFIATYQDLGYIKNNILTIISPKQKVKQFDLVLQPSALPKEFQIMYDEIPKKVLDNQLEKETIANYQTVSKILKLKQYQKK